MSGTSMEQEEQTVRQTTTSANRPARQIGERGETLVRPRSPLPQVRPQSSGEIRDPLGSFSEAIGAYFG